MQEPIDTLRLAAEQLRRYVQLDGRCRELVTELPALEAERASLKDAIETDLETFSLTGGQPIDGFEVSIQYGKPVVDWQRAFRAVATTEAVKRLIDASPRATVLKVAAVADRP